MSHFNESLHDFIERKYAETHAEMNKFNRIKLELQRNQNQIIRQKKIISHFSKSAIENNTSPISGYIKTRLLYDFDNLHVSLLKDIYNDYIYWMKDHAPYIEGPISIEDFETHINNVFMPNQYGRGETYTGYCGVSIKYLCNTLDISDIPIYGDVEGE